MDCMTGSEKWGERALFVFVGVCMLARGEEWQ